MPRPTVAFTVDTREETLSLGPENGVAMAWPVPVCDWNAASFVSADFKDAAALASRLRTGEDPLSRYLRKQFYGNPREIPTAYDPSVVRCHFEPETLYYDLTRIMRHGTSLHSEYRFDHVPLTKETKHLARSSPDGGALARLNRLLLEEAYPEEISKSHEWDLIVAQVGEEGWYNPFRFYRDHKPTEAGDENSEGPSLYLRFTRLADAPDERLFDFCAKHGLPHWPFFPGGAEGVVRTGAQVLYPFRYLRALVAYLSSALDLVAAGQAECDPKQWRRHIEELGSAHRALTWTTRGWVVGLCYDKSPVSFRRARLLFWRGWTERAVVEIEEDSEGRYASTSRGLRREPQLEEYSRDLQVQWSEDSLRRHDARCSDEWGEWGPALGSLEKYHRTPWLAEKHLDDLISLGRLETAPDRNTYDSLADAMIAMLRRDLRGGGHYRVCTSCGRMFLARHSRQVYCPPDKDWGDFRGCGPRFRDRKSKAKKRRASAQTRPGGPSQAQSTEPHG